MKYFLSSVFILALGLTFDIIIDDLQTFGFLFENLCIRDLQFIVLALVLVSLILEADFVLHLDGGRYALIEF
ncbi:MAG: hypothetical protein WC162_07595 [Sphaerochaetaceae bacterium]|nr:hypothetical protein [Sphaerochaetaceae bacterium]